MNAQKMNNARAICVALGCCLVLAAAAAGQSGMGSRPDGTSPALPTAQERALLDEAQQSDNAAVLAMNAGRYAEAMADVQQAYAEWPYDLLAPYISAQILEAEGNVPEALKAYQVLVDRGSSRPQDLMPYALLLLRTGQWAKALAAYQKALPRVGDELLQANSAFSPDLPQPAALEAAIHIARGLIDSIYPDYARQPQHERALAEFQKALSLEPSSDLANYYYGYGLRQAGYAAQAQAAFAKTVKMAHGGVKVAAEQALTKLKKPA